MKTKRNPNKKQGASGSPTSDTPELTLYPPAEILGLLHNRPSIVDVLLQLTNVEVLTPKTLETAPEVGKKDRVLFKLHPILLKVFCHNLNLKEALQKIIDQCRMQLDTCRMWLQSKYPQISQRVAPVFTENDQATVQAVSDWYVEIGRAVKTVREYVDSEHAAIQGIIGLHYGCTILAQLCRDGSFVEFKPKRLVNKKQTETRSSTPSKPHSTEKPCRKDKSKAELESKGLENAVESNSNGVAGPFGFMLTAGTPPSAVKKRKR